MDLQTWIDTLDDGERNYLLPEDRMQLRDWLIELQQYRDDLEKRGKKPPSSKRSEGWR